MNALILQIIFICGIVYGLIMFFIVIRKGSKMEKYQLMLSISLVVMCTTSFLLTLY